MYVCMYEGTECVRKLLSEKIRINNTIIIIHSCYYIFFYLVFKILFIQVLLYFTQL